MHDSDPCSPLAPLQFIPAPHPRCRATVIIPAKDEADTLTRTLDALRCQREMPVRGDDRPLDLRCYEVLLLLNNCSDASESVAIEYSRTYPEFALRLAVRSLPAECSNVGTARRLLMDAACVRLRDVAGAAILSTDADTTVAPDWIARNLHALEAGADAVGGVIHLFPEELEALEREQPAVAACYRRDRELQRLVARLESVLDPDPADPWPRHLEHFGASLACTPEAYARAGGIPHVPHLEDIAFVDSLRKVNARIRHCPQVHIFTSARMDGRADRGLSGQLRYWREETERGLPHVVDSAAWFSHRFSAMASLRRFHASRRPQVDVYPEPWRSRLLELHAERLSVPRFLELLDCNLLIEEMFAPLGKPRHGAIGAVIVELEARLAGSEAGSRPKRTARHPASAEPALA